MASCESRGRWGRPSKPQPPHPLAWLTQPPPCEPPAGQWHCVMEKVGKGTGTPSLSITHKRPGVFQSPFTIGFLSDHTPNAAVTHWTDYSAPGWGANSAPVTFHCTAAVPSHCSRSTPLADDLWFFVYSFRWVPWNFHSLNFFFSPPFFFFFLQSNNRRCYFHFFYNDILLSYPLMLSGSAW